MIYKKTILVWIFFRQYPESHGQVYIVFLFFILFLLLMKLFVGTGMVVHAFNSNIWEVEVADVYSFEISLVYIFSSRPTRAIE